MPDFHDAIATFLAPLERDIRAGRHTHALAAKLTRALLRNAGHVMNLDEAIEGEVSL